MKRSWLPSLDGSPRRDVFPSRSRDRWKPSGSPRRMHPPAHGTRCSRSGSASISPEQGQRERLQLTRVGGRPLLLILTLPTRGTQQPGESFTHGSAGSALKGRR